MDRTGFKIEICANSVQSCIAAQSGGADRVELCAGIPEGGTTPSLGTIRQARESISIALNVIIRPRGGDFLYSESEIRQMEYDIRSAIDCGADGVVFGCLTRDGEVDMRAMERLMNAVGAVPVTFHRAFDFTREPYKALEEIASLGCCRILTSGCKPMAEQGISMIARLVDRARNLTVGSVRHATNLASHDTERAGQVSADIGHATDATAAGEGNTHTATNLSTGAANPATDAAVADPLVIMPGCGINENNIALISRETRATEFHFSARESIPSKMVFRNTEVLTGSITDEFSIAETTARRVSATIDALLKG